MYNKIDNQLAYRFTTLVSNHGRINIPKDMQKLYNKKVEIILFFPDEQNPVDENELDFYKLIDEYNQVNEPDLEIKNIFNEREQRNGRKFIFD